MSSASTCAVLVARDHPLAGELLDHLGVDALRADAERLGEALREIDAAADAFVWMHMVPASARVAPELHEAELLIASARAAESAAGAAGASLTFLALVPSRGLFAGPAGLACDLARTAFVGLIESEIGSWSAEGRRIAGVVYAGLEGHELDGQRPQEEVRRRTPIGSLSTVGQLAEAVRFLGSSRASYVTGALLHVDGGWNAYSWIYPARTI
jgi:hypothetical protein